MTHFTTQYRQYLISNDMLHNNIPIELPTEDTDDIVNNISTITDEISDLTQQRNDYISLLQKHTTTYLATINLFIPCHRIPIEVLGEILLLCIPNNSELSLDNWYTTLQIFLNVCHRWRTAAIDNPYIWNYLYLLINDHHDSFRQAIHIALTWFKYMGTHRKLDLTIHFPYHTDGNSKIKAIYKILQPQYQIHNLQIIAGDIDFKKHLSELYLVAPPFINKLTLRPLTETYHTPIRPETRVFFSNALQPKQLVIKGQNIHFLHPSTFKYITTLSLESNTVYTEHFCQILEKCTKIKDLCLTIRSPIIYNTPARPGIHMEHLQSLCIKTHKILPRILSNISAPNITQVNIRKEKTFLSSTIYSLTPFLSNLKKLDSITVGGFGILDEKPRFEETLSRFSYLTPPHIVWTEQDSNHKFETSLANYITLSHTTDSRFTLDSDEDTELESSDDDSDYHNEGASGPEEIITDQPEE